MNGIIDLDPIAQHALETIDGFTRDIARVDADILQTEKRLQRYIAKHEHEMRGLKADRRQRVTDLAAFRDSVRDELSNIEAAIVQRRDEQKENPGHEASFTSPASQQQ